MIDLILSSLVEVVSWTNLLMLCLGVFAGGLVGALPGLGFVMMVAIAIPFTYAMEPLTAILLLLGIFVGGVYGGCISAILINTPGTAASAATVLDGYPMAKQGKAERALLVALYSSVGGNILSTLILILVAAPVARLALKFGPIEYFSLMLFALSLIGALSGTSILKGLFAALLGLLLALVGMDPISGDVRFAFGTVHLMGGIATVPLLIGLFAGSELFVQAESGQRDFGTLHAVGQGVRTKWRDLRALHPTIFRSSLIGSFIGAMPGLGAGTAAFLSYGIAQRFAKHPEKFGHGSEEGVAASEAANNAVCASALIPTLTLGVPGDVTTAVLLGAFMIHDLTPGPLLFRDNPGIIYSIYIGLLLINIPIILLGLGAARIGKYIAAVRPSILFPVVLVLVVVGSYSVNNSLFDVGVTIVFAILGYLMRKMGIPLAPTLIAFILGGLLERSLRQSLIISGGSFWKLFFSHPIALVFLLLTLASIALVALGRRQEAKAAAGA